MTENKRKLLQLSLFIISIFTTTFAGVEWGRSRHITVFGSNMEWNDFYFGLQFSIPFLLALTVHEFGHYFTARYHRIKATLPYYIPFWLGFLGMPTLGTMGALIKIKEAIKSRTHYFDVGISGPIAGFVVAVGVLVYGFTHLPETEYIYEHHPEYELYGENFEEEMVGLDEYVMKDQLNAERYNYELIQDSVHVGGEGSVYFGDNLLMMLGRKYLAPKDRYVPSSREIMHYPWLLAGFLALFFTALNLLPIGQLDGGHVIFGLFGPVWHQRISSILFTIFVFYAGLGLVTMEQLEGTSIEDMSEFLLMVGVAIYALYLCAYSLFPDKRNRWLYAAILFGLQFFVSSFLGWQGYNGWMLFGVLLGRVIGIQHPPVLDNAPLTPQRKVLGWIALIIFILSFSPEPLVMGI